MSLALAYFFCNEIKTPDIRGCLADVGRCNRAMETPRCSSPERKF